MSVGGKISATGDISTAGSCKVAGVAFVTTGIDCGGYLKNRSNCDIGGPCVVHNLQVIGGFGSGTGRASDPVSSPTTPPLPTAAAYEAGPNIDKSDLLSGTTPNESTQPPTTGYSD
jgi:hypothetical protein